MTREGLIKSLDWARLGVTNVFSAENGEAGFNMAKRVLPDIVLTDIRMPRMDGITMAGRIRELLPECRIVFLSAYSQIDYYKAAIDLKAIRYLDKPVEPEQLSSVVESAVAECMQLRRYKFTDDFQHMQERQKFADLICAGDSEELLGSEYDRLKLRESFKPRDYCTAVIVSFRAYFEGETQEDLLLLAAALSAAAVLPNLFTIRHKNQIALLLFTPAEISEYQIKAISKKLKRALGDHTYSIAIGKTFKGLANANKSYLTAKTVRNKAYLYPWGQVVCYSDEAEKTVGVSAYAEMKSEILRKLSEENEEEAILACENLYHALTFRKDLVYLKARELYFEIIYEVFHKADARQLQIKEDEQGEVISWIVMIESYNLCELNEFLRSRISMYFASLEKAKDEKKQVLAIKNYIAMHFMNNMLSIGDISGYLHMSASYVCTMFKKETDDTINNYLTEFRLNKAKQYLRETPFTVAEISAKVGYSDSSYFGRIFRKRFGMTPNDYRNQ